MICKRESPLPLKQKNTGKPAKNHAQKNTAKKTRENHAQKTREKNPRKSRTKNPGKKPAKITYLRTHTQNTQSLQNKL